MNDLILWLDANLPEVDSIPAWITLILSLSTTILYILY